MPIGPELLGRLYEEQVPALVLYARQWCDSAEDVVQESLVRLVRQPEPPDRIVPWLYHVVRNAAIGAGRSAGRRRRHESNAAAARRDWFVVDEGNRLDGAAAADALARLPIEVRETIVARLWGGLSFEEVAELTGSSSSTAHRRYASGLAALRENLRIACPTQNELPKT